MEYIQNNLNEKIAKKIFGNKSNAIIFLTRLFDKSNKPYEKTTLEKMKSSEIWKLIIKHWNYQKIHFLQFSFSSRRHLWENHFLRL